MGFNKFNELVNEALSECEESAREITFNGITIKSDKTLSQGQVEYVIDSKHQKTLLRTASCSHVRKSYVGLSEVFDYCEKCNQKL